MPLENGTLIPLIRLKHVSKKKAPIREQRITVCMPVSQIHKESVLALLTLVVLTVSNVSSDLEGQRGAIGVAHSVFHAR